MKIAIIGTGGVGGYFGGKLVKAGYDVTFLARGEHLKALQTEGLKVKSIQGDFEVRDFRAMDQISDMGSPDLTMVCVKAWQIKEIREDLKTLADSGSMILPLQNGVMAAEELMEAIDRASIIGGLCRIISMIEAPGVINHIGVNPTIIFGEIDGRQTQRVKDIQEVLTTAGIESKLTNNIQAELWKKFMVICTSALLGITKATYGEIRELPETRKLMIDLVTEIYHLSQKIGVNIEPDFVEKTVSFIDTFPHDSTSSLTRDVWEGKPSEIEYQNGTVVKLGEKYGVDTPINRFVYQCVLPMELKARHKK
ncbi:2-dehydropantoate 2-reductase [Cryomorphaceae bacterium 1068]|nr:2-dehydropantoate 2-reductase [Cryomorphaceae bacterium 1068]